MLPVYKNNLYYSKDFKATGGASSLPLRALSSSQHDSVILTQIFFNAPVTLPHFDADPNAKSQTKMDLAVPDGKHGIHSVLLITDPDAYN